MLERGQCNLKENDTGSLLESEVILARLTILLSLLLSTEVAHSLQRLALCVGSKGLNSGFQVCSGSTLPLNTPQPPRGHFKYFEKYLGIFLK